MQLVPRKPFGERAVRTLRGEVDRLFEDFFRMPSLFGSNLEEDRPFMPAVDVCETDTDVVVEAELPGVDPAQVEVNLDGGSLVLRGERKHEEEKKTKNAHRVERFFGQFERRIGLPEGVNPEDVEATYKEGVLTVRIGKREEVKPRSIPVKVTR